MHHPAADRAAAPQAAAWVEVRLPAGRVVLRGTEVPVPRLLSLAPRLPSDARAAAAVAAAVVTEGNEHLSVAITDPGGRGRLGQVLVEVAVPPDAHVTVDAGEAEVVCTGMLGGLTASTSSGSVHAEDVRGPLSVRTGRGSVTVARCAGPTSVTTSSGVIVLREVTGTATLTDRAGDVHVWWLSATAEVVTASGNVRLGWHRDRPVHLDLTTTGGRLQVSVPDDPQAPTAVRVSSIAGDVRVEPADPLG
jgi:hypothetical protein